MKTSSKGCGEGIGLLKVVILNYVMAGFLSVEHFDPPGLSLSIKLQRLCVCGMIRMVLILMLHQYLLLTYSFSNVR